MKEGSRHFPDHMHALHASRHCREGASPSDPCIPLYTPQGTAVVGCAVAGLMGIDENGEPFEIDPQVRT